MRHNTSNSDAVRLARAAATLRAVEARLARQGHASEAIRVARDASRYEARALELCGYPKPEDREAWEPGAHMARLRVAEKLVGCILAGCLLLGFAASASAEPKTRKPSVCVNFEVIVSAEQARAKHETMLGVCRDGKRPKLFTNWLPVTINDGETDHTYTVGF